MPKHRSFKLSKKRLKQSAPVPSPITLLKQTYSIVKNNKKLFLGIALINALVSFVFVQGLGSVFDTAELKRNFEELLGEDASQVSTGVALFGYLIGSAGTGASEASGIYQMFLVLVISLAAIWGVRQVSAGEKPRVRDAFYKGMYPLIPFLLLLFVVALQLIPLLIGNLIYSTVVNNGLAVTAIETALWLILFIALALLSFYMLASSLFSLYIVTLPDMTPMKALRSARELVLHRRFAVGLRILALPLVLGLVSAVVFIPLLIYVTTIAQILFMLVASLWLVATHIYMYLLYRSLI